MIHWSKHAKWCDNSYELDKIYTVMSVRIELG